MHACLKQMPKETSKVLQRSSEPRWTPIQRADCNWLHDVAVGARQTGSGGQALMGEELLPQHAGNGSARWRYNTALKSCAESLPRSITTYASQEITSVALCQDRKKDKLPSILIHLPINSLAAVIYTQEPTTLASRRAQWQGPELTLPCFFQLWWAVLSRCCHTHLLMHVGEGSIPLCTSLLLNQGRRDCVCIVIFFSKDRRFSGRLLPSNLKAHVRNGPFAHNGAEKQGLHNLF